MQNIACDIVVNATRIATNYRFDARTPKGINARTKRAVSRGEPLTFSSCLQHLRPTTMQVFDESTGADPTGPMRLILFLSTPQKTN